MHIDVYILTYIYIYMYKYIRKCTKVYAVAHLFMRTDNRASLEMRCLFSFEKITICDTIHAVLIENENISTRNN